MQTRSAPLLNRPILRILVIWMIQALALLLLSFLMEGVRLENVSVAIVAAAVIGLLNALLWPLLTSILLPFAVLTLGLAALLLNGAMVWLAAELVDGFTVYNFWSAFWLALGLAAINLIFSSLLTIDDDNSWYRNAVKRRMRRIAKPEQTDVPGVIFLEIDGLARPVLEKAMAEGFTPTMQRWLDSGTHVLTSWETDTSSQTSASQAGILHGNNGNIPAFRWFDKERGEIIASSNAKILPELEAERSDGNGLLCDNGTSRGNLFSGDATYVMATASTIRDRSKFHTSEFQAYFANPYNVARTLMLFIWDMVLEWRQYRWARNNNVLPILDRHHRGGIYPLLRASMTVLMRELNINTLLGDIFAGRPSAYATFVAYDEIAHHSGVLDPGAFDILRKLDQQFGRLESALKDAPRPYHLVILSDHGQTGGATFKQRYGFTLQEFVQQLMSADIKVGGVDETGEGASTLNFFLSDAIQNDSSATSKAMARVLKSQTVDGEVILDKAARKAAQREEVDQDEVVEEMPDVVALASGNLGLVSFTEWPERMTKEQIDAAFPAVIPGLTQHEGIGFVMVRSEEQGALAIGAQGIYYLDEDRVEGENPLVTFGPHAPAHLRRTSNFNNCPDILVNSFYDPDRNEGCAFEELIGFHGGLGGYQTQPFILHPSALETPSTPLVGAASVYHLCKNWLQQLNGETTSPPTN